MTDGEEIITVGANTAQFDASIEASAAKMRRFRGTANETFTDTATSVRKADAAVVKFDRDVGKLDDPLKKAAASQATLRKEAENFEKVASLLGPRVGGLVQVMGKLGKVAGSDIGGASRSLLALGAGVGAIVAGMGALVSVTLDTITNIDDLADSLDVVTQERLAPQIEMLRENRDAIDDAADSWTELKIVIASVAGGPLADLATVLSAVTEGWAFVGEAAINAGVDVRSAMGPVGDFLQMLEKAADLKAKVDEWRNQPTDGGWSGPGGIFPKDGIPMGQSVPPTKPVATPNAPARVAATVNTAANRAPSGPSMAGFGGSVVDSTEAELDALAASIVEFSDGTASVMQGMQATLGAGFNVTFDAATGGYKDLTAATAAALDHEVAMTIAAEEAKRAARAESSRMALALSANAAAGIGQIADNLAQHEINTHKESTLAYLYAVNERFGIAKAFALTQAIMNAAVGFTQEVATKGLLGVASGAAVAIAAGIEIATISTQAPPTLHTGGAMAPDEYVVRRNEVPAMLTAEGARDRQGLADVNAGRNTERAMEIFLVDDRAVTRMRRLTKPNPDLGLAIPGFRV